MQSLFLVVLLVIMTSFNLRLRLLYEQGYANTDMKWWQSPRTVWLFGWLRRILINGSILAILKFAFAGIAHKTSFGEWMSIIALLLGANLITSAIGARYEAQKGANKAYILEYARSDSHQFLVKGCVMIFLAVLITAAPRVLPSIGR